MVPDTKHRFEEGWRRSSTAQEGAFYARPKIYKAGETITATLTLEGGHAVPREVWVSLDLQPAPGAPPVPPRTNRIADLTLQTARPPAATPSASGAPAAASAAEPVTLTVQAVVPKHIVGGVYKATNALLFMPDGSQRQVTDPDPDGDCVRHIADDPPTTFDTPVIADLD